jgi:hypothetical protein
MPQRRFTIPSKLGDCTDFKAAARSAFQAYQQTLQAFMSGREMGVSSLRGKWRNSRLEEFGHRVAPLYPRCLQTGQAAISLSVAPISHRVWSFLLSLANSAPPSARTAIASTPSPQFPDSAVAESPPPEAAPKPEERNRLNDRNCPHARPSAVWGRNSIIRLPSNIDQTR